MRYRELSRFIQAMERSGIDAAPSRVERALKIAVPFTCIIIALFGAPLATSSQRGGSAYGIAVSLATTMIFLLMIQLTKAVGSKGVIPPDLAAWVPGALFGLLGLILLTRVRT
jgi:lipopolysaccharide export system permease protein